MVENMLAYTMSSEKNTCQKYADILPLKYSLMATQNNGSRRKKSEMSSGFSQYTQESAPNFSSKD